MKAKSRLLLVFAVALLAIAPSPALAAGPSSYVVLKGGVYSPSKTFDINNVRLDTKNGFDAEIALGQYFLPMLGAEFGVGYFESKASPAIPPGEVKLKVVPVTLTGKVFLPMGPIEPYGEFGIGAYITKADVSGTLANFTGSTKGVFGLHAGGGVNLNITNSAFIGAEGRYLWAKPSFGGQDIKLDGFTVTGNLGFRF